MGCPHEGLALLVSVHTSRGRHPRLGGARAPVLTMALRGKRRPRPRRRGHASSGPRALLRARDRGVLIPRARRRRLHVVLRLHLRRLQDLRLHRREARRRRMQRRLRSLRLHRFVLLLLLLLLLLVLGGCRVPIRPPLLLELLLLLLVRRARRGAQHLEVDHNRPPVRAEVFIAFAHKLRVV